MLTNRFYRSLLCLGLLCLPGAAGAQVYQSYDADGNVVFSDRPTRDSIEVKVGKPNLSDSLEIPPPPPVEPILDTRPETPLQPEPAAEPVAEEQSADTNKDGRISRREREAERKARRKARREAAEAAGQE